MGDVREWYDAAASNIQTVPDGAPENWKGAQINAWGREVMAAARRWYDDPEWTDPFWILSAPGAYTLLWISDTVIRLVNKDVTGMGLVPGMKLGIVTVGGVRTVVTYVSAVFGTHSDITVEGAVVPASPGALQLHVSSSMFGLGWGGQGTEAERDLAYPTVPDNAAWFNTDTGRLDLGTAGSWVGTDAASLGGEPRTSFVQNSSSTAAEALAGEVQTIASALTVEEAIIGGMTIHGDGAISSDVSVTAPFLSVEIATFLRGKVSQIAADTISLSTYDSGGVAAAEYQFGEDGSVNVKDTGGSFVPLFGEITFLDGTGYGASTSGWKPFTHSTGTAAFAYPVTPDGTLRFKVEAHIYGIGDAAPEWDTFAICNGTAGDVTSDDLITRAVLTDDTFGSRESPNNNRWFTGGGDFDEDVHHTYMCVEVTPGVGDVITLAGYFKDIGVAPELHTKSFMRITPLRG